jgi:hypothetical protein
MYFWGGGAVGGIYVVYAYIVGGGVLRIPDIYRTDGFVLICDLVVCVYHPLPIFFVLCLSAILWVSWIQVALYCYVFNTRWWSLAFPSFLCIEVLYREFFLNWCCGFWYFADDAVAANAVLLRFVWGMDFFAMTMSESTLYRLLTFYVPNHLSIFLSLGRLSKESVQVRGPLRHFVTSLFYFTVSS